MWDEIGRLQFDYLVSHGLRPGHRLLDVGCGCLRGGVHFIAYLADGHYYGIDRNAYLLESGRQQELALAGLSDRQVTLLCRDDFDFSRFGVRFDFALAQSVFTHLPWTSILQCLIAMRTVLAPDGRFFATFFEDPDGLHRASALTHTPGGITTFPDRDPYHYEFSTFEDLARRAGLRVDNLGDWDHPRAQRMMVFRHSGI
jgi:SAM-dependent methyltransferase